MCIPPYTPHSTHCTTCTTTALQEEVLGKDPSTFFTIDFFMHDTQATPVVASNTPSFNTILQYVVDNDPFLVEYLDTHVLELELNRWVEGQAEGRGGGPCSSWHVQPADCLGWWGGCSLCGSHKGQCGS